MSLTKFDKLVGRCVPVPGADIDTDRIIPARFLKCITFDDLAGTMFYDERFNADGSSKGHPIDDARYQGASIMLAGANFGCGSSREHAPQAIKRSGIQAIVAESFAEIFFGNSIGIGLPCVTASSTCIEALSNIIADNPQIEVTLDLQEKMLFWQDRSFPVEIVPSAHSALVNGNWDSIAGLLANKDQIVALEKKLPY